MLGSATALALVNPDASHGLFRRWAQLQLDELGIELHVHDESDLRNRDGVLFVDLHQQTLLTALVYPLALPRPVKLIINVEYAFLPFIGWLAYLQGRSAIVRQSPRQSTAVLKRVAQRLRDGETFGISIEGQRTQDGRLSPYKKGPAALAIDAQCDIVPFMSHGEYALWPRGQWRVRPGRIDCTVYKPLSTKGLTYADRDDVVNELRRLAERETKAFSERQTGPGSTGG
jgi:1-acyl-sn-glycerol-3-phosphate acyltransferase